MNRGLRGLLPVLVAFGMLLVGGLMLPQAPPVLARDAAAFLPVHPDSGINEGPSDEVSVSGPTSGLIQIPYTFTATVSPLTATTPVTYVWTATGQAPVTNVSGLSDTAILAWDLVGVKSITVVASNLSNTVTGTHAITIEAWAEGAPIPDGISFYGFAQCPDDPDGFYVIGGADVYNSPLDGVYHYDASTDNWTTLATLPTSLYGLSATCYEGHLYAAGGNLGQSFGRTDLFYVYDIDGNSWGAGPTLPRQVFGAALAAWDGEIFLVGGDDDAIFSASPTDQVDIFDISTNTWSANAGAAMPTAVVFPGWVQAGRHLYLGGGITQASPFVASAAMQRYDLVGDLWETGPPLSVGRAMFALGITEAHLYAVGGVTIDITPVITSSVEIAGYASWPAGTWQDAGTPLPGPLFGNSAGFCTQAVTGGEVWSVGGGFGASIISYSAVDANQYRPAGPCIDPSPEYGLTLTPDSAADSGHPGETVVYVLAATNLGDVTDTFTVTVGESGWTTTVSSDALGPLLPDEQGSFSVTVEVPEISLDGDYDTVVVTLISHGDPLTSATSTLTTTAAWWKNYLPLITRD